MDDVSVWLERAADWRFASLLFQEPHAVAGAELHALVPLLPVAQRTETATLAAEQDDRSEHYYAVLGPGGCPASESAYDQAAMANRGPLIAEVSAFYEAFAYPPRLTSDLAPDHVAVELDFLGFLALKVAFALHEARDAERDVAETAFFEFLDRHPRFWMSTLRDRLQASGNPAFAHAATWVCKLLDEAAASAHASMAHG
jgi:TorA maturation chaperone TorD